MSRKGLRRELRPVSSLKTYPRTSRPRPKIVWRTARLDVPLQPDLGVLDERRRGFLSKLSRQRLKYVVFDSLDERIEDYIEHHNANGTRSFRLEQETGRSRGGMEERPPLCLSPSKRSLIRVVAL